MASRPPAARWRWLREQIPVTRHYAYCNSGFAGPMSLPVAAAMSRRMELELEHGPRSQTARDDEARIERALRAAAAQLFAADPDEIVLTPNTTEGLNIALNGMDLAPGDVAVTTSAEHGGGMVPAYRLRDRRGLELRIVSTPAADSPAAILDRFAAAIDGRTRVVIVSEITFRTGARLPLAEIVWMAHAHGAVVVADGAQSAGHMPLDVRASGVDAYAVTSHKWLCGPAGAGFLYLRREHIAAWEPVKVGLTAAARWDADGAFEPAREDPRKFEVSTASAVLAAGALAALEQYQESGPAAVWDRVRELVRIAERRFAAIPGCAVTSPQTDEARTGLLLFTLRAPTAGTAELLDSAALAACLEQRAAVIARSVKGEAVRLCLHLFNTEDEIERAAATVEAVARDGLPPDLVLRPSSEG